MAKKYRRPTALDRERREHERTRQSLLNEEEFRRRDIRTANEQIGKHVDSQRKTAEELSTVRELNRVLRGNIEALQHELRVERDVPTAYHGGAERLVPLKFWSNFDILKFLHLLEEARMKGDHAHGLDATGQLTCVDAPFPTLLLLQVTQEVSSRGITSRSYTDLAVAR